MRYASILLGVDERKEHMAQEKSTILAFGADGKFAGLVIPALAAHGVTIRGLVHNVENSDAVLAKGASEVVAGDLTDLASMKRALDGITSVFYIGPAFLPDEATVGTALVEAAIDSGVKRFVFSSVIHPVLSRLPNHARLNPISKKSR